MSPTERSGSSSQSRSRKLRGEVGAVACAFAWLNAGVLDKARAEELADGLDLDRVTYCAACVFELAWAIHTGHTPHWQTVARVARWTWAELEESLFAALVDARCGRCVSPRTACAISASAATRLPSRARSCCGLPSAWPMRLHIPHESDVCCDRAETPDHDRRGPRRG